MRNTTNDAGVSLSGKYEAALQAVREAERKGMAMGTLNRKWRAVFAAEDALKAAGMWS